MLFAPYCGLPKSQQYMYSYLSYINIWSYMKYYNYFGFIII
ncbi:LOW QUALITY PROTEIN: hypothetical protein TorRG33x02_145390 [Trema orientale]|uniref:Uncharacterized protein n=1 Tax=Trema orientale TaxID=63057 RepID=A0A2P5EW16_TREOI|nr:LOW QUALITY PROTEIN: hypothetical protein TorRG33x02_145390 [Trema orientale]